MEPLKIDSTESSPFVALDPKNHRFEISGNSFPSNALEFYDPILKWLNEYLKYPIEHTEFNFKLDYFNSTSAKFLTEILMLLAKLKEDGHDLNIVWHYYVDDDEMRYAGDELSNLTEVDFEFVTYE
ncbi:MAG: DUF1987 domain-containing protein [Bacteroidetes bacterium]|nr:DUF1987 domain-containing protein [Bacteroidota bacterium]